MTPEQQIKWDSEMQERVFGASPADDYNFKTRVFPKYSTDAGAARDLVEKINASGRYRVDVRRTDAEPTWSVQIYRAEDGDRLTEVRAEAEAEAIVEAIVTADVKL